MVLRRCPAQEEINRYAAANNWARIADSTTDSAKPRREIVWKIAPATTLLYVEDDMSPNCFVVVGSGTASMANSAANRVYEELRPWSLQDLTHQVDESRNPLAFGRALTRLGIAAPHDFDPGVYDRMVNGLRHADERVRDMSIWATTYSPWPEYRPVLADIAAHDEVDKLRERAQLVLDAMDATGVPE